MADVTNIAGRINSISQEGVAVLASQTLDERKNKKQSVVNQETDEELANHGQRIGTLEQEVGSGGSVDERIAQAKSESESDIKGGASSDYDTLKKAEDAIKAEAAARQEADSSLDGRMRTLEDNSVRYTPQTPSQTEQAHARTNLDTYSKAEVNQIASAFTEQNYVSVQAVAATTAADIPTLINATGDGEQTDTLYRVGWFDGTAFDVTKYSLYTWNGTAYVQMAICSSIGEVFDISVYNQSGGTPAQYETLALALGTDGANVPSGVRQGGMSVKFIQSNDNKYVQYRLMATNWSTTESDWQGVDVEPTAWSKNLVESGGVYPTINAVNNALIPINGRVSIIGDSISTYRGTVPSGYATFYPQEDVTSVYDMWWELIISLAGSQLDVNASWSGSFVTNAGSEYGRPDFYDRTDVLGTPDCIFVALGANDSASNVGLGDYDYESSIEQLSESEFIPAYTKGVKALIVNYPSAKIVLLIFQMKEQYADAIRNIGSHYGLSAIDVRSYYNGSDIHPYKLGMQSVAQDITSYYFKGKVDNEPTPGSERIAKSGGICNVYGQYINNPEFLKAVTDNDENVLYGVKADGDFHFGNGVPSQIQNAIDVEKGRAIDAENALSEYIGSMESELSTLDDSVELIPSYHMENLPESHGEQSVPDLRFKNKVLNAVGDSVTNADYYRTDVAKRTNLTIVNCGVDSSSIAINNTSISNKSFVERILGLNGNTPYGDADIWMIFGGINDIKDNSTIGEPDDTDNSTVYGALKSICAYIRHRPNNPKLILVTPYQLKNLDGEAQRDVVKAIKYVAKLFACPVIDLYNNSDICHSNIDNILRDGIHPIITNNNGKTVLSTAIARGIINELLDVCKSDYLVENPEYIHAIVGNNERVIEAITSDGKKEINLDLEVNGSIDMDGVKTSNVENKEYINVLQDGKGKVLGWVNENGGVDFADIPNSIRADVNEALRKEGLYPATAGSFYEGMSRSELVRVYNSKIDGYAELCRYNSVSLYELSDTDSDELLYWKINHNFREYVVWEGMSDKAFVSQLNKYFNIPVHRFQDAKMSNPNIYEIGNVNKVNKSRFANYYDREPEYVNMEDYPTKSFLCMMDSTGVPPMSDGVLSPRWREVTRNNSYPAYDNTHTYHAPFSRGTEPSSLIVDDGKKIRLYSATGIFSETEDGVNWYSPTRLKDAENNNLAMPGHPSVNYVDGMFMLIGCTSNNIDEGALALYTSTDGISFTYKGKIKGTQCGTDNIGNGHTFKYLGNTYLFKDYDGTYYLYYEGWENDNVDHPGWEMCLMTCTDLFRDYGNDIIGNWTQCNENPIFPSLRQGAEGNLYNKPYTPGNPEIVKGEDNQPLKYNGKYYMYFHTGHIDNRIERAYSYDLVHWTHEGSMIASRDVPDYGDNSDHCMCQFKGRSYLFYTVGINGSVVENGHSVYYRQDDLRYVIDDRPLIDMLKIKP